MESTTENTNEDDFFDDDADDELLAAAKAEFQAEFHTVSFQDFRSLLFL